jgi:hypothetical protein
VTNDEARQYFKDKGLTYDCLNELSIDMLINLIDSEILKMRKQDKECILISVNKRYKSKKKNGEFEWIDLTVKGTYFDNRQAISFERDGFIGFAGWASTKNTKPFIDGFIKWCDAIAEVEDGQEGAR